MVIQGLEYNSRTSIITINVTNECQTNIFDFDNMSTLTTI